MDKGRLNEIFNDASEAVIVFDERYTLIYSNIAAQNLFQYTPSEFEKNSLLELLSPDMHDEMLSFLKKASDKQKHILEREGLIVPKDRQKIPANLLLSTITREQGNIQMMVVEPLKIENNPLMPDYQLLAESLPDVVSLYDAQNRCLSVNPAARHFYGHEPSAYQDRGGFLGLITPDKKDSLRQQIEDDTRQKVSVAAYTYPAYHSDGSVLQVQATVRRFFDETGALYRLIAFEKAAEAQSPQREEAPATAMLLLNRQWQVTYFNDEAGEMLDHPATNTYFTDLLHPEDTAKVEQEQGGSIRNGIVSTQRKLRLRSKKFQHFQVTFDKFFDENGLVSYIIIRLSPADEDNHSPQAGRSQFLKLLAEHVDEVVCFFYQDFSFKYVSPSVTQALGYSEEELQGRSIFELIHPDERTDVEARFQQNLNAVPQNFSCRFQSKDGSYVQLELDFRMLESLPAEQKILPFLALLKHVPQLRDVATPETIFTELSDHITDALAMVELPSLTISKVNQHLLTAFSAERATLEGKTLSSLFKESDALTQLEQSLLQGEESFQEDIQCLDWQQTHFWANVAVSFFICNEKKYALIRLTDISERKAREEQLQQARQEAETILKSREEFLSTMSHEIRTPLNAILGMTHLMLQGQPRQDQVKLLQTLKFSGDSLTTLINDILDFSKIEAGQLELAQDDFNLRKFLHNIKLSYKNLAQDKGLIFRTLLEEELPEVVNGDVHRLGQIFNNLLNNAIKFTEDGYIILSIYVDSEEEDHYQLLFEVADTGIGIPEEKQAVIFDPYQQASQRTSRYFGGTGLGLSIVKKLVEQAQGKIQLESKEGQGTTFKIKLRFAKPDAADGTTGDSDRSFIHEFQPLDGLKVLYVEDVIPNQFLMEGLCDTWHIQLDTALDGLEALEKVKNNHYDLILMDIYMPGMDGFEAAQEIRNLRDPHYSHVPILALSASISDKTRNRILERGMDDYIAKPINPQALHQKLWQYAKATSSITLEAPDRSREEKPLPKVTTDTPDFSQLRDLYTGDKEGYDTIIMQVLKLSEESAAMLKEALISGNLDQFRSSSHKIMSYIRLLKLEHFQELIQNTKEKFEAFSRPSQEAIARIDAHFSSLKKALTDELHEKI